jgi:hypothetical protein
VSPELLAEHAKKLSFPRRRLLEGMWPISQHTYIVTDVETYEATPVIARCFGAKLTLAWGEKDEDLTWLCWSPIGGRSAGFLWVPATLWTGHLPVKKFADGDRATPEQVDLMHQPPTDGYTTYWHAAWNLIPQIPGP